MTKTKIEHIVSELFVEQQDDTDEGKVKSIDDQEMKHTHEIFENLCLASSALFD